MFRNHVFEQLLLGWFRWWKAGVSSRRLKAGCRSLLALLLVITTCLTTACGQGANPHQGGASGKSHRQQSYQEDKRPAQKTKALNPSAQKAAGQKAAAQAPASAATLAEIPEFSGQPFVTLNNNVPEFKPEELTTEASESFSDLDELGRCGVATALVGREIMPTEKRGMIGMVKPSGWHLTKYDFIAGKYLYNRCHLIAYELTGQNANPQNLITGTRYLNIQGMLPFENKISNYVKYYGRHVRYRVTPVFKGEELVARGVQMEAWSVEDKGEGIHFNIFAYNVQPGVSLNYADGSSRAL